MRLNNLLTFNYRFVILPSSIHLHNFAFLEHCGEFLNFDNDEAKSIFWHTSAHVLAQAVLRLYPKAKTAIGPAIDNGFYYDFDNLHISENDFLRIEKEIKNKIK